MQHTNFITNQEQLMSQIINQYMGHTQSIDMLVGYFYFSGFKGVYESLVDKKVRILVGMEAQTTIGNKVQEIEADTKNLSNSQKQNQYLAQLVHVINETDEFDRINSSQSWKIFVQKLQNGTLEIRQTKEPNHSKVYLFYINDEYKSVLRSDGIVITGSSNLTYSGLLGRNEANVILNDNNNFCDARDFFEDLWQDSTPLVGDYNYQKFEQDVSNKIWINNLANPFMMYIRVLEEYFGIKKHSKIATASSITKGYFMDLHYQTDAVAKALEVIENHNGVIVADVVGLGKSIIGSVVAHNLDLRTIVITPPHLTNQWKEYGDEFGFYPQIYSAGNIEKALEQENEYDTKQNNRNKSKNKQSKKKLIIIDEAHKFRNELTDDYSFLHQICQGNKVILLTATPFNNSPQDLYSLIKLFQTPGRSTLKTVENLAFRFESLITKFKKIRAKKEPDQNDQNEINNISNQLKLIIEPLIIRRSRLDLVSIEAYAQDLKNKGVEFASVQDPKLVEYELGDLFPKYIKTLELICPAIESKKGFVGAKYKPTNYLKDRAKYQKDFEKKFGSDFNFAKTSQENLAKLMKNLLIKRFESSIFAFEKTLNNMISYHQNTLDWYHKVGVVAIYKKGNLPTADEIMADDKGELDNFALYEMTSDEIKTQNLAKIKGLETIEIKNISVEFAREVQGDLDILNQIKQMWFGSDGDSQYSYDPKFETALNQIQSSLQDEPNRKIVIFSEFADTVNYLETKFLSANIRVLKYTSKIAKSELKKAVRDNFDAGLITELQKNDYDIIVATDAISEGYNLHRAGMVINYDIPFNPTRVIQRVGRINRINKKVFDKLFILNFFPSLVGKKEYRVEGLATLKMSMIHALLGEDTKVLKADETGALQRFLVEDYNQTQSKEEQISWDTKYQNLIRLHRDTNSEEYVKAILLPKKSRTARKFYTFPNTITMQEINLEVTQEAVFDTNFSITTKKSTKHSILIFAKKGKDFIFKLRLPNGDIKVLTAQEGISIFETTQGEEGYGISPKFDEHYQDLKTQIFITKNILKQDKGEQDTIKIIKVLQQIYPKDLYLKDLVDAVTKFKGLPDGVLKSIRDQDCKNPEIALFNIKNIVSETYLNKILGNSNTDTDQEIILFAQELI